MVLRPRTSRKIAIRKKRCPKCGKLVGTAVRCKTCHKPLKA